ncbi:MAG: hypothetical protein HY286_05540 [Planctomycetes bacterium]|nr:hypothetical protein [Planctomycetota bacterium]
MHRLRALLSFFLLALVSGAAISGEAAAQGPLLPTLPWFLHDTGPYATNSFDWNNGNVQVTNPNGGGNITVQHFGVVWYPADANGNPLPPITPYPFIVFAHGRFQQAPYIGTNHKQATYLLQHLASWGFVVSSVNLDVVGQYSSPAAIPQRGELINDTVQYFMQLQPYAQICDFNNIIYIGHSRGGEGAFAAVQQTPSWLSSIRGVGAISPTNFQLYTDTSNAFIIYGSQDGDVNNGWPIQLYDQTKNDRVKGFRFIEGANHFFFTDSITYSAEANPNLTRDQHHEIAKTLMATWCFAMDYGDRPSLTRIAGDKEIQWSSNFNIHRIFRNPRRITIDDFEQSPPNVYRNSIGGTNLLTGLINPAEKLLTAATDASYNHVTKGLTASWNTPAMYSTDLSGLDIGGYSYVTLNLLQRYNSSKNPIAQPQRFHLSIADSGGNTATLDNTDIAPWPYPFYVATNGPVKSVLKTFRFPVSAFTALNGSIDLTTLKNLTVNFDITATGDFALDDVAITQ